jgi:hypothetical protein
MNEGRADDDRFTLPSLAAQMGEDDWRLLENIADGVSEAGAAELKGVAEALGINPVWLIEGKEAPFDWIAPIAICLSKSFTNWCWRCDRALCTSCDAPMRISAPHWYWSAMTSDGSFGQPIFRSAIMSAVLVDGRCLSFAPLSDVYTWTVSRAQAHGFLVGTCPGLTSMR